MNDEARLLSLFGRAWAATVPYLAGHPAELAEFFEAVFLHRQALKKRAPEWSRRAAELAAEDHDVAGAEKRAFDEILAAVIEENREACRAAAQAVRDAFAEGRAAA